MNIIEMGQAARAASKSLAFASTAQKNAALYRVATGITDCQDEILDANSIDVEAAISAGINEHVQDRLVLNSKRLSDISDAVQVIAITLPYLLGLSGDVEGSCCGSASQKFKSFLLLLRVMLD